MTLSREEIAVWCAIEYAIHKGYSAENAARQGRDTADALLRALALTPAPVAPPAGPCPGEDARDDAEARKRIAAYVPKAGDVVNLTTDRAAHVVRVALNADEYAMVYGDHNTGTFRFDTFGRAKYEYLRDSTAAEKRAAGLAVPPPATAGEGLDDIERSAQALADFKGTIPPGASDAFMLGWRVRDREAPCDGVARTTNAPTPAPEGPVRLFPPVIVKTDVPPMVGEVCRSPAPEAKRVRCECCGEMYCPAPCPPPVAGSAEKDEAFKALLAYAECEEAAWGCGELEPTLVLHGKKRNEHAHEFLKRLRTKALALSRPVRP